MDEDRLTIDPPLYLIGKMYSCWRCGAKMPVVAILAPKVEGTEGEICILSGITELPEAILAYIQGRVPTFKLKFSKTIGQKYFASTCPKCGVLSGDFRLHSEPGAPFFPTDEHEAASLEFIPIKPLAATGSGAHGSYAGHNRFPSPDRGHPPSTSGAGLSRCDSASHCC
jgi:hypothetical protein